MENKVVFDGTILNEVKVSEFNTALLRIQNKQEYTKKDGTKGESSCTMVVSVERHLGPEIVRRFKRGDIIHVEGSLQLKKSKKLDDEGREIYETWIRARKIDAIPGVTQGKTIEQRSGYDKTKRVLAQPLQHNLNEPELGSNPNDQSGMDDELPF